MNQQQVNQQQMNRRQKRMLRKQGEIDAEGAPVARRRQSLPVARDRVSFWQFIREVRSELRKVAWPSTEETVNYSIVVLITVVVLTSMIYGLDWVFSTFVLELFETP